MNPELAGVYTAVWSRIIDARTFLHNTLICTFQFKILTLDFRDNLYTLHGNGHKYENVSHYTAHEVSVKQLGSLNLWPLETDH